MYSLKIMPHVYDTFKKMGKREKKTLEQINGKIEQILANPGAFKPLRAPMQNKRRVHIGSFVLVYEIDETEKAVVVLDYAHHDEVYGGR